MSSVYRKPFKVGDVVASPDGNGTVIAVNASSQDGLSHCQAVCVQHGENATESRWYGLSSAEFLNKECQLKRLGQPPTLRRGDVVVGTKMDGLATVSKVGLHGSITVSQTSHSASVPWTSSDVIAWPNYRKARPEKGGLGKFKRGDFVKIDGGCWKLVIAMSPFGLVVKHPKGFADVIEREAFPALKRVAKDSEEARQIRVAHFAPTSRPATAISKEVLPSLKRVLFDNASPSPLGAYLIGNGTGRPVGFTLTPVNEASDDAGVKALEDVLDGFIRFQREGNDDQALGFLRAALHRVLRLRFPFRIGGPYLHTVDGRSRGINIAILNFINAVAIAVKPADIDAQRQRQLVREALGRG